MVDELKVSYKCYIKYRSNLYFKTNKFFYINDHDMFETRQKKFVAKRSLTDHYNILQKINLVNRNEL